MATRIPTAPSFSTAPMPGMGMPFPGTVTNIGTTVPPFVAPTAPIAGVPVARFEHEGPTARIISEDPPWIARWQNSATVPLSKAPWVIAYRWWSDSVAYETWGPTLGYRIDMKFKDGHKHAYVGIEKEKWQQFMHLTSSVGQWLHENILGKGWTRHNRQSKYRNFPI